MSTKLLSWAPAGLCILTVCIFTLIFHYRAPYHDHWDLIPLFEAMQTQNLALRDLFGLHGNHWHASGYIVMLGLSQVTDMGHWAESMASIGFAGVGYVALIRILSHSLHALSIPRAGAWVIGLSAFFFFSLDQSANWLWGWQVAVFINLAGALWTIERLTLGRLGARNALLAALCCAASIYAFGTGWTLIPIGFALLFFRQAHATGKGRAALAIWAVMTGLLLWHFALALNDTAAAYTTNSMPNLLDAGAWIGLVHYTLNFVASPIVRFARDSALLAMLIGFGILAWSIWTLRATNKQGVWVAIAPILSLAGFSLGSGLLTAMGRWESFGVKHAFVSRYISFGSLFWIAVFVLAILAIAKTRERSHKRVFAVLGLLFVLKLGNIPSVVQKSVKISNEIAHTTEQLAREYPDVSAEDYAALHSPFQTIEPHLAVLADHEVSFFANGPARESEIAQDEPST